VPAGWRLHCGYGFGVARVAKQLLAQFEEDTAYERFALYIIATAGQPPNPAPPPRDDLRGGGLSMSRSASDWLAAEAVGQPSATSGLSRLRPHTRSST
jgi:hypothetical protein